MQATSNYLPNRKSIRNPLLLLILLFILYFLESSGISNYILPVFWIGISIIISQIRRVRSSDKLRHRKTVNFWAFYFAIFFILINIFAGLIAGFGRSPYNHSPMGIFNVT